MKTFKKILAVLLALGLTTGLTACNQGGESKIPVTPSEKDTIKKEIDYDNLVTDAHSQTIGAGIYSIPQINYDSEDCEEINAEIWETLYDGVVANISADFPAFEGDGIFYKWSVHNDVLSLLIESTTADIGWTEYYVYNVDLSDGTVMTNKEVLSKADVTSATYQTKIQTAVETKFYENMSDTAAGAIDVSYIDTFNSCLLKSKAEENIEETTPYFNEKGQLCTVIKIYSMAGADFYWNILNLSDEEFGFEMAEAEEVSEILEEVSDVAEEEVVEETAEEPTALEGESAESQGTALSQEEAQAKLEEWLGDLGTWVVGDANWLMCDGSYQCDGKNYYQFRLKGNVGDHATTLTLYVISEDGTEMFEGSCDQGSLNRY